MSEECSPCPAFGQEVAMMMVRKSKGLGERHQRILDFLQEYQRTNKYPPSIREIGVKTGISSTSVVNYYLDQLEKRGLIERDRKISRGVRLAGINGSPDMLRVPILGPIAAGLPLPELSPNVSYMTDSEANAVDIARSLLPSKEKGNDLYALEVKGESMIDAMINDGDIVVLKPATDARNGEMVAVWLPRDNEATLKYFFKEKDRYRLQPANPTMKPIFVKKSEPLEIKGKVVMVIRRMDKLLAS
jgi:repressor LexA